MSKYYLIIPVGMQPRPTKDEEAVAKAMAGYLRSDIRFVERVSSSTPDIYIIKSQQRWEIKHIRGNSKRTIANNLRSAKRQCENIIISLSRTDMTIKQAEGRIKAYLNQGATSIKRIIIVSKQQKILVIK